jgi:3-oxoadipate enol-lactonase
MKSTLNGIEVNYRIEGPEAAPVVVLSHSLAASLEMWRPQAAALEPRYRVLSYDTRGHGASAVGDAPYSFELLADDAAALMDHLGIERCHFVGLSLGGMVGMALALRSPQRLISLALCDTMAQAPEGADEVWAERVAAARAHGMAALVEATMGRWFTAPYLERHSAELELVRAMIGATPVEGYVGCCGAISALDYAERLGAITLPTLIVVGADDMGTPVACSEDMQRRIPGSRLEVLPSAAHLSNLEQPEAFNRALTGFLDAL